MMRGIKKATVLLLCLITLICVVSLPVYAARTDGELIFAKDLAVGEIVTVQIATGTMKDAFVVGTVDTPRLILLENLGANTQYSYNGSLAYDTSNLKQVIDSRTIGHDSCIFNISAPFATELGTKTGFTGIIDAGINKVPGSFFWTRSSGNSIYMMMVGDGTIYSLYGPTTAEGVRPSFNLKADTVLKYTSGKYIVSSNTNEKAKLFLKMYGFSGVIYVPEGQAPAGYTALTCVAGANYKLIEDQYLFVYAQEYTPPTDVGNLNIN